MKLKQIKTGLSKCSCCCNSSRSRIGKLSALSVRETWGDSGTDGYHTWRGDRDHSHTPRGGYTRVCCGGSDTCRGGNGQSSHLRMCNRHRLRKFPLLPKLENQL